MKLVISMQFSFRIKQLALCLCLNKAPELSGFVIVEMFGKRNSNLSAVEIVLGEFSFSPFTEGPIELLSANLLFLFFILQAGV